MVQSSVSLHNTPSSNRCWMKVQGQVGGSLAGRTIMSTSRGPPRHGSNQVEDWFAELTRKQIQRGVHTCVRQIEADIRTFIELHNNNPKPFTWTKSADQIFCFCQMLLSQSSADFMWRTLDSRD